MGTDLKDYIRTYDSVFTRDFCDATIVAFSKSDSIYLDREQRPSYTHLNISQRFHAQDPLWMGIQRKLSDDFTKVLRQYIQDVDMIPDLPVKYGYEEFRMKKYENNNYDEFRPHVDVGDHATARRFLVVFLYLNDVEEGGETDFPKLGVSIKPECGKILVFPPTWQYRHAGKIPVSNDKYIIGSYLHYQ